MGKVDDLVEHILVNYRWIFVCFFLLPISVVYDVFAYVRNFITFKLNSAPTAHLAKVSKVQKQVLEWKRGGGKVPMCTGRPGWQTMSFRRGMYKNTMFNVHIDLVDVLEIDEKNRTIRLEPLVTMGQLTATIAPLGWTLPVLPEIDDLTVGGMVMGTGIESSSHIYGLFQHNCISFELVLADGSVVTCSETDDRELFYSIPWSHGTLGFLTAVEMKIIPVKKYIKLGYKPVFSLESAELELKKAVEDGNEFVEGLMFDLNEGVIMCGNMSEDIKINKLNEIGKWYKPWFFKHVQTFLTKGPGVEYLPVRDYYHRHTRSIFWELQDIIPFGNNVFFRYLFGWAVPPKVSLLKLTQTSATKKLYEEKHIIQDMLVPINYMKESLKLFNDEVLVYPIWLCPFKLPNNPGFVHSEGKEEMYLDIGVYGVPKTETFKPEATTRKLEEFVRSVKGFQMLYADTYMSEEEFRTMFDHKLYDKLRKELNCDVAFPTVYGKVNKKVRT